MKTLCTTTTKRATITMGMMVLFVLCSLSINTLEAQNSDRTVTGVVNSIDGPVFGASIVLKGTATGVVSNEKGEFIFPEPLKENDILVINYLGYKTNEVTITGDTSYIQPFLEDISITIVAALRTENDVMSTSTKQ